MAEVCLKNKNMKILVPEAVDVNQILAPLNITPTIHKNLKNKIYYFLSRIVTHNDNYHLYEKSNGYIKIDGHDSMAGRSFGIYWRSPQTNF